MPSYQFIAIQTSVLYNTSHVAIKYVVAFLTKSHSKRIIWFLMINLKHKGDGFLNLTTGK